MSFGVSGAIVSSTGLDSSGANLSSTESERSNNPAVDSDGGNEDRRSIAGGAEAIAKGVISGEDERVGSVDADRSRRSRSSAEDGGSVPRIPPRNPDEEGGKEGVPVRGVDSSAVGEGESGGSMLDSGENATTSCWLRLRRFRFLPMVRKVE